MEQVPSVEIPEATKNGDVIQYKLVVDGQRSVFRVYDDFSWLMHCIRNDTRNQGIIYPPLPRPPVVDARQAERKAKEQYGSSPNVLPSDPLASECRQMERFLRVLLAHPIIGSTRVLTDFLTVEDAPPPVPTKMSRVLKWSASVTEKLKSGHKDVSPFFEDERNKTNAAVSTFKSCCDSFTRMMNAYHRLTVTFSDLSVESIPETALDDSDSTTMKRFGAIFSKIYTDLQHVDRTLTEDSERTMGRFFTFYGGYYEALKDALYRRTCLLIASQDAAKAAEKAKPERKAAAEEAKAEREKEFDDFSHELKEEIVRFHRDRVELTHKAVVHYSRSQTKAAVDRHALVTQELNLLKNIPV